MLLVLSVEGAFCVYTKGSRLTHIMSSPDLGYNDFVVAVAPGLCQHPQLLCPINPSAMQDEFAA